jgi:hypothetical protein
MKPSMSAAVILVTTAPRPSRPRRRRAALRSGSLDCLVCRKVGPACAQRAAMLISGGGFCFVQPPAVGKRSTAGGDRLSFQFAGQHEPHSQSAIKRNKLQRSPNAAVGRHHQILNTLARRSASGLTPINTRAVTKNGPRAGLGPSSIGRHGRRASGSASASY